MTTKNTIDLYWQTRQPCSVSVLTLVSQKTVSDWENHLVRQIYCPVSIPSSWPSRTKTVLWSHWLLLNLTTFVKPTHELKEYTGIFTFSNSSTSTTGTYTIETQCLFAAQYMIVNCKKGVLDGYVRLWTEVPFSCVGVHAQWSILLGARTLQALKLGLRTKG